MHLKRWLTAIVAIPFLVAIIIKSPPMLFAGFIGVVAFIALWEYYLIALSGWKPEGPPPYFCMGRAGRPGNYHGSGHGDA